MQCVVTTLGIGISDGISSLSLLDRPVTKIDSNIGISINVVEFDLHHFFQQGTGTYLQVRSLFHRIIVRASVANYSQ